MKKSHAIIWVFWILLAAWGMMELRHLRVSNSLEAWMPDIATPGPYRSYVVIGIPSSRVDAAAMAFRLRELPEVSFCIDPFAVRATGWLNGLSVDGFVISHDGAYSGIFCFARAGIDPHLFLTHVQKTLRDLSAEDLFAIGGPIAFQCAMDDWSQDRLPLILIAILLVGGGVLFAVTHSFRISIEAMAAIGLSQVIFLGAVCRLRIPLDMSGALVPPMMMGMGFSYAAHRALRRNSVAVHLRVGCGHRNRQLCNRRSQTCASLRAGRRPGAAAGLAGYSDTHSTRCAGAATARRLVEGLSQSDACYQQSLSPGDRENRPAPHHRGSLLRTIYSRGIQPASVLPGRFADKTRLRNA